jgi:hypothetical protein
MAEPYPLDRIQVHPGSGISLSLEPAAMGWGGASPLWRSILSPPVGQRVLILEYFPRGIFEALLDLQEGIRIEERKWTDSNGSEPYDLVLEEIKARRGKRSAPRIRSPLVAPGGRWIAVIEGSPAVGLRGRALLRQARKEGFEKVETFYAHPSLGSPKVLVPLDRIEPIRFFLDFAMGVPTMKKRCLATGFSILAKLGVHREMLPNMILTARRTA